PDVEEALAWIEPQLAADVLQLARLGVVESRVLGREVRAAVDELPVEPEPVERIGDVVVVADIRAVAAELVPPDAPARHQRIASVGNIADHALGYGEGPPRAAGEIDVVVDVGLRQRA